MSYIHKYKHPKLLSFWSDSVGLGSEIYDLDSASWRSLDGEDSAIMSAARCSDHTVSFKGNTYWFALEKEKEKWELGVFLLSFDFATHKFGRVPLPFKCKYQTACFSVVGEEKLAVLLDPVNVKGAKTEIWVTRKIGESDETKWTKVLALDLSSLGFQISDLGSILFDEEKKVVVYCERWTDEYSTKDMVYIVGEDSNVTQAEFGVDKFDGCWPAILNYSPSLVQIERSGGKKRKRFDMELIEGKTNLEAITIIKNRLKTLDKDIRAIGGLAWRIPYGLSLLKHAKSELESLLHAQLSISNRNSLRALLES